MNNETLVPFRATHPGELLKDELKERDMSQKQLAEATGIKASVISETIKGKRSVSLNMAVALEKELGMPLFDRSNRRKLTLEESGEILYRAWTPILEAHRAAIREAKEIARKFGWACML